MDARHIDEPDEPVDLPADGLSRRDVLRRLGGGGLAAVAGAGLGATAASTAEAAPADLAATCPTAFDRVSVDIVVRKNFTLDDTMKVIAAALRPTGCPMCGLQGIDLRLRGDPAEKVAWAADN